MVDLLLADVAKLEYAERLKQAQFRRDTQFSQERQPWAGKNLLLNLRSWLTGASVQPQQPVKMHPSLR